MTKRTISRLRGMLKGRAKPTSGKATPSSGPKPGSNTVNHQGMIKEGARTAPSRRSRPRGGKVPFGPTKGAPPKATATPRKAPPKSTNKPIRHTRGMARGFAALKNKDK
jgi:hypothetical protein